MDLKCISTCKIQQYGLVTILVVVHIGRILGCTYSRNMKRCKGWTDFFVCARVKMRKRPSFSAGEGFANIFFF